MPLILSPTARKVFTHSPEKNIRRIIFSKPFIFQKKFSSTRKIQLWQPCRTFFARSRHFFAQFLTILMKSFFFERKIFTSKFPFGHEECCLNNSAKNFLPKVWQVSAQSTRMNIKRSIFRNISNSSTKVLPDKKKAVLKTMQQSFPSKIFFYAQKPEKKQKN